MTNILKENADSNRKIKVILESVRHPVTNATLLLTNSTPIIPSLGQLLFRIPYHQINDICSQNEDYSVTEHRQRH